MKQWLLGIVAFYGCAVGAVNTDPFEEELARTSATQGYHENFIDLVELVYGQGFLSQGATDSVDLMFLGIDLEGKTLLDLGSGLGGPDLYLAKKHPVDITGIDPQPWMVERANAYLAGMQPHLRGKVQFLEMKNPCHLNQFASGTFDVVCSKEAILHLPPSSKKAFFEEIFRVLRSGGELVILDWMQGDVAYSEQTKKMMEMDGLAYHMIPAEEYENILKEVGFTQIIQKDCSQDYVRYSSSNLQTIEKQEALIEEKYDHEIYLYSVESWSDQRDAFAAKEILPTLFRAKKS